RRCLAEPLPGAQQPAVREPQRPAGGPRPPVRPAVEGTQGRDGATVLCLVRRTLNGATRGEESPVSKVSFAATTPNTRRGGDIRVLLSPRTVGATSGFMGALVLEPGEFVAE